MVIIKRLRLRELDIRLSSPIEGGCLLVLDLQVAGVTGYYLGLAGDRFALDVGIQLGPGPRIDANLGGREVIVSLPAIDRRSYARGLTHFLDLVFKLG